MTRTTPEQDALLAKVHAADEGWRLEKRVAFERHRQLAERDVASSLGIRDAFVRQAFDAGVAKSRIAKALSTSAPITVEESLKRTAVSAATVADSLADPRFSIDPDGVLMVTLTGDELAQQCDFEDWTVADAIKAGVDHATFKVGPYTAVPFEPGYLPDFKRKHPVVAWASRHDDEIVAWYAENAPALVGS